MFGIYSGLEEFLELLKIDNSADTRIGLSS
jgi:hypothetical protein